MSKRPAFTIETLPYTSTRLVWLNGRKVAIVFPPIEPGGSYHLYPHPGTFRSLTFEGLPAPLRPGFTPFESLDALCAFLGIRSKARTRQALALSA